MTPEEIRGLARACGFELAGVAAALPSDDVARYQEWVSQGRAGAMRYLTDHRAAVRADPRNLLSSARSILCVGKLYQTPYPQTAQFGDDDRGWISRYAWGDDYHDVMRRDLLRLVDLLHQHAGDFEYRICIDTAPLLERTYARLAGLGWIGRNTCLINQAMGSWFFLGEVLLSLALLPDSPPPDRCGTCMRCVEACPTSAILPEGVLDARLCISYYTIELRGTIPEDQRGGLGEHIFGCDICQDVCPWNRRAPVTGEDAFSPRTFAPSLEEMALLSEEAFHEMFRHTPVSRARYTGFLRNVAVAMGNSGNPRLRPALEKLSASDDAVVAEHARWALGQLASDSL